MLRLRGNRVRWSERDALIMADLIGPDGATAGSAICQDSLLKLADRRGLRLHPELRVRLREAERVRQVLRELRTESDPTIVGRRLRRRGYPATAIGRLFDHQKIALSYMTDRLPAYLLADGPGVGKTPVAILWAWRIRPRPGRILVITPNSAKTQWAREIQRWVDEPSTIVAGTIPEQIQLAAHRDGWVIAHWEALVHAADGFLTRPWDVIIADEAHRASNRRAKRTETLFALESPNRLALTGHPFANSPDELFSLLKFLMPEEYTSYWRFFHMHVRALPLPFGGYEVLGARRPKLLRWELSPFTLRRTKRMVFPSLPPITRTPRYLELSRPSRREYDRLRRQFFVEIRSEFPDSEKIIPIPSVLARVMRLRQYLVDPGLIGGGEPSVKYPAALELLNDLDGPPVIFTAFRQAALRLQAFLAKMAKKRTGLIAGGLSDAKQQAITRKFLAGQLDALVVVQQAGGESLNLGRYGYVIFLDLPWTAKTLEQCEGRVDRPEEGTGKMVPTTAYRLIVQDSYEEKQEQLLEDKHARFGEIFNRARLEALFA